MRRQIMFVTYLTDGFQKAFSYSTELARMMGKNIAVLIITRKKDPEEALDDYMTAVAFAESGDYKFARDMMPGHDHHDFSAEISYLWDRCREMGIQLSVHRSALDIVSAINNFVKQQKGIDMILIGSTITSKGSISAKELKKLVRTASRPVVTIGEEARVA